MTFRFYYQTADNGEKLFLVTLSSGSMSKAETKSIKRNLRQILESNALIKYLVTWRYALFPQVRTHFRLQQRRKCLSLVAVPPTEKCFIYWHEKVSLECRPRAYNKSLFAYSMPSRDSFRKQPSDKAWLPRRNSRRSSSIRVQHSDTRP